MSDEELREHNQYDSLMTEALLREHPEWSMETIREAALICSNALVKEPDTTFLKPDAELSNILDKYGRDIAVSGLHNGGFSTSAQKILKKLEASLQSHFDHALTAYKKNLLSKAVNYYLGCEEHCPDGSKHVQAIPVSAIDVNQTTDSVDIGTRDVNGLREGEAKHV